MKVAIFGAGFTGLSAAINLIESGVEVEIFEKSAEGGGLAAGFQQKDWDWSLEKAYHHWFTNDSSALNLAAKLNFPVVIKKPKTTILVDNQIYDFDSAAALLKFSPLPLFDRLRTAVGVAFLKLLFYPKILEGGKATSWIKSVMGNKSYTLIWQPILQNKFDKFLDTIALPWFWARIYKRTSSLAYPKGGFAQFTDKLLEEVKSKGGKVYFNCEIKQVTQTDDGFLIKIDSLEIQVNKIISTLPSPILVRIFPQLPKDYIERITSIPHLDAQNLILILDKPFFRDNTYWLSIADSKFPFLVLAEHTNFMDKSHYGNQHILYIGNYLPQNHPYLEKNKDQLLGIFDPYLKKLNPDYKSTLTNSYLFNAKFAQPVVSVNYSKLIPELISPIKGLFIANMDMVYPWDRGTNYAIEMGEKVAQLVIKNK